MKNRSSVFWSSVVGLTAGAALLVIPLDTVLAADATPTAAPPPANAPVPGVAFGVSEVIKMYQGGINKDVIENYIANTSLPFHLSADNIIYLQNLGMPQEITKALLQRDSQMQQQSAMAYQQQQQQPPPQMMPPPNQAVAVPSSPPPPVTYASADYSAGYPAPYYDYGYPYYGYYGGYWPPVVIGGGWGWGGWRGGYGGYRGGGYGGFHGGYGGFRAGGFGGFHGGGGHGGHR
jgi:hypothetical protein